MSLTQSKNKTQIKKDFQIGLSNNFNKLSLKNVSFEYPNLNKKIFNNIFRGNKGDKIGVVGSGSGKSTFIDIVTGLISPSDGNIYFNGNLVKWKIKIGSKKLVTFRSLYFCLMIQF